MIGNYRTILLNRVRTGQEELKPRTFKAMYQEIQGLKKNCSNGKFTEFQTALAFVRHEQNQFTKCPILCQTISENIH